MDKDIDRAAEALKTAKRPRRTPTRRFSSSICKEKLRITEDECIERAIHCVKYAKKYVDDVGSTPRNAAVPTRSSSSA